MPHNIGIDIGGTKIEIVLLEGRDRVRHRKRIPTPQQAGYDAILSTVQGLISECVDLFPASEPYTIGIGIPGAIDPLTRTVYNAPNTACLIGKPFQTDIENRLGMAIKVENDANCFTLAESLQGATKGYQFVFGIIMGTGCGGGICINGNIRQGLHGMAGEWGHFSVDPLGASCYCGNRGCVETKISGSGVENSYFRKYGAHLRMHEILDGYRSGDTACRDIFSQFLKDFGRCVGGLISTLDPDAVVLGGGLSNIDELYTLGVQKARRYAFHREFKTPVLKNHLGDSAGVFGAAWLNAK